jgi:acyl-coenzyme A synthetase/AMP-(fatty) acid ligase
MLPYRDRVEHYLGRLQIYQERNLCASIPSFTTLHKHIVGHPLIKGSVTSIYEKWIQHTLNVSNNIVSSSEPL